MAQIHTQETWCYSSRSCRFVRVPRGNVELDHTGQECIYLPCLADHTDHQVGIDHTEDMSEVCIGYRSGMYLSALPGRSYRSSSGNRSYRGYVRGVYRICAGIYFVRTKEHSQSSCRGGGCTYWYLVYGTVRRLHTYIPV